MVILAIAKERKLATKNRLMAIDLSEQYIFYYIAGAGSYDTRYRVRLGLHIEVMHVTSSDMYHLHSDHCEWQNTSISPAILATPWVRAALPSVVQTGTLKALEFISTTFPRN